MSTRYSYQGKNAQLMSCYSQLSRTAELIETLTLCASSVKQLKGTLNEGDFNNRLRLNCDNGNAVVKLIASQNQRRSEYTRMRRLLRQLYKSIKHHFPLLLEEVTSVRAELTQATATKTFPVPTCLSSAHMALVHFEDICDHGRLFVLFENVEELIAEDWTNGEGDKALEFACRRIPNPRQGRETGDLSTHTAIPLKLHGAWSDNLDQECIRHMQRQTRKASECITALEQHIRSMDSPPGDSLTNKLARRQSAEQMAEAIRAASIEADHLGTAISQSLTGLHSGFHPRAFEKEAQLDIMSSICSSYYVLSYLDSVIQNGHMLLADTNSQPSVDAAYQAARARFDALLEKLPGAYAPAKK